MVVFGLIARFSAKWASRAIFVLIALGLLRRFFFQRLVGILILSLMSYGYFWYYGEVRPYTLSQLILWVDGLDSELKSAVVSSVVTVIGFLVAFHTSTLNWRAQERTRLQLQAAEEIDQFFAKASKLIIDAELYACSLMKALNQVELHEDENELIFEVDYVVKNMPAFVGTRSEIVAMSIDVNRVFGRYGNLMASLWGVDEALKSAINALREIADKVWFDLPVVVEGKSYTNELLLRHIDRSKCQIFVDCVRKRYGFINAQVGGVSGRLKSSVVDFTAVSFLNLLRQRRTLLSAIEEVRNNKSEI